RLDGKIEGFESARHGRVSCSWRCLSGSPGSTKAHHRPEAARAAAAPRPRAGSAAPQRAFDVHSSLNTRAPPAAREWRGAVRVGGIGGQGPPAVAIGGSPRSGANAMPAVGASLAYPLLRLRRSTGPEDLHALSAQWLLTSDHCMHATMTNANDS